MSWADLENTLTELQEEKAELLEALEKSQAELKLLRTAVATGDPLQEVLLRISDLQSYADKAIAKAKS